MGKLKNYVAAGATAVLASTTSGQMALDKTVTNTSEQAYKTIVFANGDENTNPSYNFTGTNNINTGLSDARA